jgi:hypothetical protein
MAQRAAVDGGHRTENDLPPVRTAKDEDATSIKTHAVGVRREGKPWFLTWS